MRVGRFEIDDEQRNDGRRSMGVCGRSRRRGDSYIYRSESAGAKCRSGRNKCPVFSAIGDNVPVQSGPIYCGDFNFNGNISGSTLSVKMNSGSPQSNVAKFSGELAANGQSLSKGTYSGDICLQGSDLLHHVQGTVVIRFPRLTARSQERWTVTYTEPTL